MSLPVFVYDLESFLEGQSVALPQEGQTAVLSGPEGRHAVSVKRITVGERIQLSNGSGAKATATVVSTSGKDTLHAHVDEVCVEQASLPRVTVVQALPKSERSELTVDLLTQGGADAIIPWEANRCIAKWQGNKKAKGVLKWRQTAIAAAKQSRRSTIPTIEQPCSTSQVVDVIGAADLCLVLHEEAALPFSHAIAENHADRCESLVIIIGPEGGISEEEANAFRDAGAVAVKLGPEVLRTATAGLVALAALGVSTSRW